MSPLLQTMIDRNRSISRARELLDKEFPSKFLFAVDLCYHSDIDDTIINFSQLVSQVIFESFHISLPPTFSMKTQAATAVNREEDSNHLGEEKEGKLTKLESTSTMKPPMLN